LKSSKAAKGTDDERRGRLLRRVRSRLRWFRAEREAARSDLLAYAKLQWPGYEVASHHRLIAEKLEAVERGDLNRLMIFTPPRHGKSQLASEFFPAWCLGRRSRRQIIAATYAQDLADDFGRRVRNQLIDERFGRIFPDCRLSVDSTSVKRFHTTHGGVYIAAGIGGPITGRGADLLLIDDPLKGRSDADSALARRRLRDWYATVAYTRLMPKAAIVLIQTRWHVDDLAGWILAEHAHENWEVLSLPAIMAEPDGAERALWPRRFPLVRLQSIRRTLGSRDWQALYMQSPVVEGGNILKRHWWRRWREEMPPETDLVVMAVDTAHTRSLANDASAATVWGRFMDETGRPNLMLLYAWAERLEFNELVERVKATASRYRPERVLIEPKAAGLPVIQELRRRTLLPVHPYMPRGDKIARAHAVASLIEGGAVWAPERPWAERVIDQCAQFPAGSEDDLVDTVSMALAYLRGVGAALRGEEEPMPERVRPGRPNRAYY
jgi:predicted phage terminase large subunit-like protein